MSLVTLVAVAVKATNGTFGASDLSSYSFEYDSRNAAFLLSCDVPLHKKKKTNRVLYKKLLNTPPVCSEVRKVMEIIFLHEKPITSLKAQSPHNILQIALI